WKSGFTQRPRRLSSSPHFQLSTQDSALRTERPAAVTTSTQSALDRREPEKNLHRAPVKNNGFQAFLPPVKLKKQGILGRPARHRDCGRLSGAEIRVMKIISGLLFGYCGEDGNQRRCGNLASPLFSFRQAA